MPGRDRQARAERRAKSAKLQITLSQYLLSLTVEGASYPLTPTNFASSPSRQQTTTAGGSAYTSPEIQQGQFTSTSSSPLRHSPPPSPHLTLTAEHLLSFSQDVPYGRSVHTASFLDLSTGEQKKVVIKIFGTQTRALRMSAERELRWLREHATQGSDLPTPSLLGVFESDEIGLVAVLSYEGIAKLAESPVNVTREDEFAANRALESFHEAGFIHDKIDQEHVLFLNGLVTFVSFQYVGEKEPIAPRKDDEKTVLGWMFEPFV